MRGTEAASALNVGQLSAQTWRAPVRIGAALTS